MENISGACAEGGSLILFEYKLSMTNPKVSCSPLTSFHSPPSPSSFSSRGKPPQPLYTLSSSLLSSLPTSPPSHFLSLSVTFFFSLPFSYNLKLVGLFLHGFYPENPCLVRGNMSVIQNPTDEKLSVGCFQFSS